jgi:hypothetical protein
MPSKNVKICTPHAVEFGWYCEYGNVQADRLGYGGLS